MSSCIEYAPTRLVRQRHRFRFRDSAGLPIRRGFTLVELLVSIAIMAVLMSLLMPALSSARAHSRMMVCLTNVRSQGTAIQQYAGEHEGRLPPQSFIRTYQDGQTESLVLNSFLALYEHQPFPDSVLGFPSPTGKWRCPDVSLSDDVTRLGHSGIFHHAPNRYLFNFVNINDEGKISRVWTEAYPGWEIKKSVARWRNLDQINRIDDTVALMDNVNFFNPLHGHRDALDNFGRACDVPSGDTLCMTDAHGSHDRLARRPALFTDGHVAALPSTREYWLGSTSQFSPMGSTFHIDLYASEVRHFMWFVLASDASGGESSDSPPSN